MSTTSQLTFPVSRLVHNAGLGGWVAVGLVLVYVASTCFGLLTVPWAMAAELFPDHLRDVGQAVTLFIADSAMSAGLQLYPVLLEAFRELQRPRIQIKTK